MLTAACETTHPQQHTTTIKVDEDTHEEEYTKIEAIVLRKGGVSLLRMLAALVLLDKDVGVGGPQHAVDEVK